MRANQPQCLIAIAAALAMHAGAAAVRTANAQRTGTSAARNNALLRTLSLHDRIAQMIIVRGYGDYPVPTNAEYQRFERWIREDRVGGFIVAGRIRDGSVLSANPFEMAAFVNHIQHLAHTPLLVGSDFERGASMRVAETASFPYMMAFGAADDLAATQQLGAATAREARAVGVNWIFAPDADVNNNPDNPIVNTRSFGADPERVAAHVAAFIDGAHSDPSRYVLVAAKHFPGHGDTAEDSHIEVAKLDVPRERLESVELVPFRAAIAHRADSIMTGHIQVPAIEPAGLPATLSSRVLTGLLREQLGFKGLIVTDAMEMAAVTSQFPEPEACVRAVEAGADVLLMPINPDRCISGIAAAVRSGRLSRQRIDLSAARVLVAKQTVGLFTSRIVSLDDIPARAEDPKFLELAQQVASRAVTLVKDEKHLVPLSNDGLSCLVIMTEGQFSTRGQTLARELQRGVPNLRLLQVNPATPPTALPSSSWSDCSQIYVAAFTSVTANRGSVALEGILNGFLSDLIASLKPVALVSLGNPYLLRDFPRAAAYLTTFGSTQTSELAAARALLGSAPINGRLPISIPPLAKLGDGISVPVKPASASNGSR